MDLNGPLPWNQIIDRRWELISPALGLSLLIPLMLLVWFTIRIYHPHLRALVLRLTTYSLLAWMVLGLVEYRYELERPRLILLLDNSLSMSRPTRRPKTVGQHAATATNDADAQVGGPADSRWSEVERILSRIPESVWSGYRIEMATLNSAPIPIENASHLQTELLKTRIDVPASELGQRIDQLASSLTAAPTAGIILFTDTMETGRRTLADSANPLAERRLAFSVVAVGATTTAAQVDVREISYPRQGHIGQNAMIEIELANLTAEPLAFELSAVDPDTGATRAQAFVQLAAANSRSPSHVAMSPSNSALFDGAPIVSAAIDSAATTRVGLAIPLDHPGQLSFQMRGTSPGSSAEPLTLRGPELGGSIHVLTNPTRVLLIDGYPRYEFRYLRNLLERSSQSGAESPPDFKVTSILMDADPGWDGQSAAALPLDVRSLADYDVVVLGDIPPRLIPRSMYAALVEWVDRQGGGLVIVAGERYMPQAFAQTPLAPLLPPHDVDRPNLSTMNAAPSLQWQLTEVGQSHSVSLLGDHPADNERTWQALTPVAWWAQVGALPAGTTVIAEGHPDSAPEWPQSEISAVPLISWRYFGMGRAVWHATDETWRWRYRADETIFARYWTQLLRYLTPLPNLDHRPVQLTAARPVFDQGAPVRLVAEVLDPRWLGGAGELTVEIRRIGEAKDDESIHSVQLRPTADGSRRFVGTVAALASGSYTGRITQPSSAESSAECRFAVEPARNESTETSTPLDELSGLTAPTGGRVWSGEEIGQMWQQLPAARSLPGRELTSRPWWSIWPVPLAIVTLLAAEWWVRQQGSDAIESLRSDSGPH